MSSPNPFISSSLYLTLTQPSLSSVNTHKVSSHVVPPCLPKSPAHQSAFRETLRAGFVCLAVLMCQKSPPLSPSEMFYILPFKGKCSFKIELAVIFFPQTFSTAAIAIYQSGCVPPLGSMTI